MGKITSEHFETDLEKIASSKNHIIMAIELAEVSETFPIAVKVNRILSIRLTGLPMDCTLQAFAEASRNALEGILSSAE
jgi:hypothetical protein